MVPFCNWIFKALGLMLGSGPLVLIASKQTRCNSQSAFYAKNWQLVSIVPLESSLTPIQLDLESLAEKEMCWKYLILASQCKTSKVE